MIQSSTMIITEHRISFSIHPDIDIVNVRGQDNSVLYHGKLDDLIFHALLGKLCCQDIDGKVIQTDEKAEVTS